MRKEIIKTENYLLVVSDEKIKEGDAVIENEINQIFYVQDININVGMLRSKVDTYVIDSCKKIITHRPLNNAPFLEGVDVLPEIENELDKLYKEKKYSYPDWQKFEEGFNKAREIYKYTEEDLRKALSQSFIASQEGYNITSDKIIQSLNQPKFPIAFECNMIDLFKKDGEILLNDSGINQFHSHSKSPKTITNSNGQTEWVGKYIFN